MKYNNKRIGMLSRWGCIAAVSLAFCISSCRDYLNVVPDNTFTIEEIFTLKAEAYAALAKVYSYMPHEDRSDCSTWILGDEWLGRIRYYDRTDRQFAVRIMKGYQNSANPYLGIWGGTAGMERAPVHNVYEGISICNIFIDNIDKVMDMTDQEKADWKAQAKFLKAYYHFLLLQRYGPIVIADKQISPDAPKDKIFPFRSKVEDCFNYIVKLMDEAIPEMQSFRLAADLGQVDQTGAAAIKARVLILRASPFYSGNREYYEDFLDPIDHQPFFAVYDDEATTKAKWQDALDAVNEAIDIAEKSGKELYTYEKAIYPYDVDNFALNEDIMQTYWNLRMVIVDPWNKELLWGYSNQNIFNIGDGAGFAFQPCTNIRLPSGFSPGDINSTTGSEQWQGTTFRMLERYYTVNGLPLDADRSFNRNTQYELTTTPAEESDEYERTRGILQPDVETVRIYLNRELRFYANLGLTGSYWRSHGHLIPTTMYWGQAGGGSSDDNHFPSGMGVQKFVHTESQSGDWRRLVRFPYPIVRLADLYLLQSEALNELLPEGDPRIYAPIDKVRLRAGIPTVETAWSDIRFVKEEYLNYHKTRNGMREIILHERGVELAFEGHRFWDMLRYKRAATEFSTPVFGWNPRASTGEDFFVVEIKDNRSFSTMFNLWPLSNAELDTNSNLVQNPGW